MLIQFADNCGLSADDQILVRNWPSFHERLKESEVNSPFLTTRVLIRGAALVGSGDRRTIIMVDVRICFRMKDGGKEQSYHLSILPGSASLLLLFHDVGNNSIEKPKATAEKLHLVTVRQNRWAADASSPEPPSGQCEKGESLRDAAWREAREEIGPDLFDDLCQNYSPRPLTSLDVVSFFQTNAPDTMVSGSYEAFACIVPVTSEKLLEIQAKIAKAKVGGLAHEGERTKAELLPLIQAHNTAKIAIIAHVYLEFMRHFGIALPPKE
jgi:ADP-ribose pyrophosphatase YjhB (NUDIX family)